MEEHNAVVVENLTKVYPKVKAVDGVSFTIKEGEIFGLLGPNGAGKTTTIRMLLTLIPPTSGSIRILGIDAVVHPQSVRQMAGYVPQDVSVDGELTGYENMLMYAKLYDVPRKTRNTLIQEALEYLDLKDRAGDLVNKYSGGMMRRLEIAQTLVNRPKILYLDEPSIGLDPNARQTIWEHIEKLRNEFGTTILLTTHDMTEADTLCHRIGIMNKGQLVTVGEPSKLKDELGGDLLRITSNTPGCSDKIKELGYTIMDATDGQVEFIATHSETVIPNLLESLKTSGIGVESISIKKPTLDDVFLNYTGARIEEGDSFAATRRTRRTARRLA